MSARVMLEVYSSVEVRSDSPPMMIESHSSDMFPPASGVPGPLKRGSAEIVASHCTGADLLALVAGDGRRPG